MAEHRQARRQRFDFEAVDKGLVKLQKLSSDGTPVRLLNKQLNFDLRDSKSKTTGVSLIGKVPRFGDKCVRLRTKMVFCKM